MTLAQRDSRLAKAIHWEHVSSHIIALCSLRPLWHRKQKVIGIVMTEIKIDYSLNKKAKCEHYLHNPRTCCVGHNFTFLPKECRVRSLDLRQNIKKVKMEIWDNNSKKIPSSRNYLYQAHHRLYKSGFALILVTNCLTSKRANQINFKVTK